MLQSLKFPNLNVSLLNVKAELSSVNKLMVYFLLSNFLQSFTHEVQVGAGDPDLFDLDLRRDGRRGVPVVEPDHDRRRRHLHAGHAVRISRSKLLSTIIQGLIPKNFIDMMQCLVVRTIDMVHVLEIGLCLVWFL